MLQRTKLWMAGAASLAGGVLLLGGITFAAPMAGGTAGHGINSFGITQAYYKGRAASEIYTKGFYCDTSVAAESTSGCELGQKAAVPPAGHVDPEYATVPIGFTVPPMQMQCGPKLVCVGHPGTIDMTRAVKPLAKAMHVSEAALLPTLGNAAVPPHNHYMTTLYGGRPEWWNVNIIGVTSRATFNAIQRHGDYAYVQKLLAAGDPTVMPPVPTNIFLYFRAIPSKDPGVPMMPM
jgi:hypothetical protein